MQRRFLMGTAAATRQAYFRAVAAQEMLTYFRLVKVSAEASSELARRMAQANNALGNAVAGMSRICGMTSAKGANELMIVETQDGWSQDEPRLSVQKIA